MLYTQAKLGSWNPKHAANAKVHCGGRKLLHISRPAVLIRRVIQMVIRLLLKIIPSWSNHAMMGAGCPHLSHCLQGCCCMTDLECHGVSQWPTKMTPSAATTDKNGHWASHQQLDRMHSPMGNIAGSADALHPPLLNSQPPHVPNSRQLELSHTQSLQPHMQNTLDTAQVCIQFCSSKIALVIVVIWQASRITNQGPMIHPPSAHDHGYVPYQPHPQAPPYPIPFPIAPNEHYGSYGQLPPLYPHSGQYYPEHIPLYGYFSGPSHLLQPQ